MDTDEIIVAENIRRREVDVILHYMRRIEKKIGLAGNGPLTRGHG